MSLFAAGCLCNVVNVRHARHAAARSNSPVARRRMVVIAWVLGLVALASFAYVTSSAGGLLAAYGRSKGGGEAASGYIGEAPLLALPAIVLLFLAWRGQRLTTGRLALVLVFASPHLIHGLLGARRGPTFLILGALMASGYLVSSRRPRLASVVGGLLVLGSVVLFLFANRPHIYIGSSPGENVRLTADSLLTSQIREGEDWTYSTGLILTSSYHGEHLWGRRLLTVLLVRPIPKQLWPTKYHDVGMGWMETGEDMGGLSDSDWVGAVGWRPQRGSAAGFIASLFHEFSYAGLIACYSLGWLYSYLWRKSVQLGGMWAMLYIFAAILSVYIPTQSVTAWLHRFLIMSIPTVILWRRFVAPAERHAATMRGARASARPAARPAARSQSLPVGLRPVS
jgi:hypothetical protein